MSSRSKNKENQNSNGNNTSRRRVVVEKGVLMKHSKFLGRSQWRKRLSDVVSHAFDVTIQRERGEQNEA